MIYTALGNRCFLGRFLTTMSAATHRNFSKTPLNIFSVSGTINDTIPENIDILDMLNNFWDIKKHFIEHCIIKSKNIYDTKYNFKIHSDVLKRLTIEDLFNNFLNSNCYLYSFPYKSNVDAIPNITEAIRKLNPFAKVKFFGDQIYNGELPEGTTYDLIDNNIWYDELHTEIPKYDGTVRWRNTRWYLTPHDIQLFESMYNSLDFESIPKKIHLIWFGDKTPEHDSLIEQIKKYNPDYDVNFIFESQDQSKWTNEDVIECWKLVNSNQDNIYKYIYNRNSIITWRERLSSTKQLIDKIFNLAKFSDALRVYLLNKYGGIYLDTDVQILSNFDSLLESGSFCVFSDCFFMGCTKGWFSTHNEISKMKFKVDWKYLNWNKQFFKTNIKYIIHRSEHKYIIKDQKFIPKILYFIWVGKESDIPDYAEWSIENYRKMNPDFDIRFLKYSSEDIISKLNERNNIEFRQNIKRQILKTIDKINGGLYDIKNNKIRGIPWFLTNINCFISDILRIQFIRETGGIYCDLDTFPLKPFDEQLLKCEAFYQKSNFNRPDLFFIGGKKGSIHPCKNHNATPLQNPFRSTGKNNWSKIHDALLEKFKNKELALNDKLIDEQYKDSYIIHLDNHDRLKS